MERTAVGMVIALLVAAGCGGGGRGGMSANGGAGTTGAGGSAGRGGTIGTGGAAGTGGSVVTGGTSGAAGTTGGSGGTSATGGIAGASNGGSGGASNGGSGGVSSGGIGGIAGASNAGSGGATNSGSAGTSNSGSAGTVTTGGRGGSAGGGTTGSGGSAGGGTTGAGGTGGVCQTAQIVFASTIPTAYLVVDRSTSMFHCLSTSELVCSSQADTSWSTLKNAIETVITQLDAQVRFGFTTIYGTNPAGGGTCPVMNGTLTDNVAPALNNAAVIKAKYDGLAWPNATDILTTGTKWESPAMYAIRATANALVADTSPGSKNIIFITDGQEDFCDDTLEVCASDSTIGALQTAFVSKVRTIVFGLQLAQFNLPPGTLDGFANAGAGESTLAPVASGLDTTAIFDQCTGTAPWRADLTASGHPTTRGPTATVGTYATAAGPTKPFKPNAADQNMLTTQLSAALASVKSCTFDLDNINGQSIKVDTSKLSQAHVKIEGAEVPLSATNGWNVDAAAPTQLVLSGTACTTWRDPASKTIDLAFPCATSMSSQHGAKR